MTPAIVPKTNPGHHGEGDLTDHLAGMLGDNGGAQYLIAPLANVDLDEALLVAFQDRTIDAVEGDLECLHIDALSFSIALIHADVSDLRTRVGAPGDCQAAGLAPAHKECVLNHDSGRRIGGVSELVAQRDIAGGKDVRIARLEVVVGLDSGARVKFDTGRPESEPFDIRSAPDSDQDLIDRQNLGSALALQSEFLSFSPVLRRASPACSAAHRRRRDALTSTTQRQRQGPRGRETAGTSRSG